jgi:3'(2'), 5'-bisphosphate nucleotidase
MFENVPLSGMIRIARQAGQEIAARQQAIVQAGEAAIWHKDDDSPVTQADRAASAVLCAGLAQMAPSVPVISEEESIPPAEVRRGWGLYFLVDPLDGTKGYLKGEADYSVCVALMRRDMPLAGVVHVPARGLTYYGLPGTGAWREDESGMPVRLHTAPAVSGKQPVVLQSRVSATPKLDAYMDGLPHTRLMAGSAYKFCLLAEGTAQMYPCLHPTWEWDTAAGEAVLRGAGGTVTDMDGRPLRYGKSSLLNDLFIARG